MSICCKYNYRDQLKKKKQIQIWNVHYIENNRKQKVTTLEQPLHN